MKILSIGGDGHDVSFTVLEDGIPTVLVEKERINRVKMAVGNAEAFAAKYCRELDSIDCLVKAKVECADWAKLEADSTYEVWHHTAHAAHAFYSSHFDEATIFTMDGGGAQEGTSAFTVWEGKGTKITPVKVFGEFELNLGMMWARLLRRVLNLRLMPGNHAQSGTAMAMAAFGDPKPFRDIFQNPGPTDMQTYKDLHKKMTSQQAKFDLSASLQEYTEKVLHYVMQQYPAKNICLSGGVALNSVATAKMLDWFPDSNIYVCPVPYDGGLSIGGAQYVWHHILENPRISWEDNVSPYLGYQYSREDVLKALEISDLIRGDGARGLT